MLTEAAALGLIKKRSEMRYSVASLRAAFDTRGPPFEVY